MQLLLQSQQPLQILQNMNQRTMNNQDGQRQPAFQNSISGNSQMSFNNIDPHQINTYPNQFPIPLYPAYIQPNVSQIQNVTQQQQNRHSNIVCVEISDMVHFYVTKLIF